MQHSGIFFKNKLVLALISLGVITTSNVQALTTANNTLLPLPPRATVWGVTGDNSFVEGDTMWPIWGNWGEAIYVDGGAKYGNDNTWFGSVGLGGRKIFQDTTLLGAYFFTDFNRTNYANHFTVLNPGVEFMTARWDGHVNGYFPINEKTKLIGVFNGNQLHLNNTTFFSGHAEYDRLFDYVETVGSGADVEIGHTFTSLHRTRIFAGGYHFQPKHTPNINGIAAGIEVPLTFRNATVELRDSYDNYRRNTFLVSLRLSLGGTDKTAVPHVADRMLDPIPRHLANWSNGNGIPTRTRIINTGRRVLIRDNIWFFNPNNSPLYLTPVVDFQSCTYEHPCIGLGQSQIDAINRLSANANFYFSSGTYFNPAQGSGYTFHNGQNIFGRITGFTQPATGNARPLLNDTLLLEGNNNIYNIRVNGQSAFLIPETNQPGLFMLGALLTRSAAGDVNIFNSDISTSSSENNTIGIANISSASNLNVNSSRITVNNTAPTSFTVGIANLLGTTTTLYNTYVTTNIVTTSGFTIGVVNNDGGILNILNSTITTNSIGGGLNAGVLNNSSVGVGNINIIQSSIVVNAVGTSSVAGLFNQANNLQGISGNVNLQQSTISVSSNANNGGAAFGVFAQGSGVITIDRSNLNVSGDSGTLYGLFVGSTDTTVNMNNSIINVNPSNTAAGFIMFNVGTFNNNGGNQCYINGAAVPCA
jgi:hypothetical protein